MKLQKQKTREVKGKAYHRWAVVLPADELEKLKWDEGDELEAHATGERLVIRRKGEKE